MLRWMMVRRRRKRCVSFLSYALSSCIPLILLHSFPPLMLIFAFLLRQSASAHLSPPAIVEPIASAPTLNGTPASRLRQAASSPLTPLVNDASSDEDEDEDVEAPASKGASTLAVPPTTPGRATRSSTRNTRSPSPAAYTYAASQPVPQTAPAATRRAAAARAKSSEPMTGTPLANGKSSRAVASSLSVGRPGASRASGLPSLSQLEAKAPLRRTTRASMAAGGLNQSQQQSQGASQRSFIAGADGSDQESSSDEDDEPSASGKAKGKSRARARGSKAGLWA
jgi:hypothetical protein